MVWCDYRAHDKLNLCTHVHLCICAHMYIHTCTCKYICVRAYIMKVAYLEIASSRKWRTYLASWDLNGESDHQITISVFLNRTVCLINIYWWNKSSTYKVHKENIMWSFFLSMVWLIRPLLQSWGKVMSDVVVIGSVKENQYAGIFIKDHYVSFNITASNNWKSILQEFRILDA